LTQLGFGPGTNPICFRFRTVRAWGPIPVASAPVIANIYDIFTDPAATTTDSILETITDYPDMVNRACIAYRYPLAQSERSVITSVATGTVYLGLSGMGPGSIVYIECLWRVFDTFLT